MSILHRARRSACRGASMISAGDRCRGGTRCRPASSWIVHYIVWIRRRIPAPGDGDWRARPLAAEPSAGSASRLRVVPSRVWQCPTSAPQASGCDPDRVSRGQYVLRGVQVFSCPPRTALEAGLRRPVLPGVPAGAAPLAVYAGSTGTTAPPGPLSCSPVVAEPRPTPDRGSIGSVPLSPHLLPWLGGCAPGAGAHRRHLQILDGDHRMRIGHLSSACAASPCAAAIRHAPCPIDRSPCAGSSIPSTLRDTDR